VVFKHALRNVLIPVVTWPAAIRDLIAFSLVTETIFSAGLGNSCHLLYESDQRSSSLYSLVAVFILTINIIVDLLYAL